MDYLHKNEIIHRDIKGANILMTKEGVIKLADFGLARKIYPDYKKNLNYTVKVVTLWYRAPELLMFIKNYTSTVDIWSLGCFFAELFLKKTLFPGDNESRQMKFIFDMCGSPDLKVYPKDMVMSQAIRERIKSENTPRKLTAHLKSCHLEDDNLIDLLDQMLKMEPNMRISAEAALDHAFFDEIRPGKDEKLDLSSLKYLLSETSDSHEYRVRYERKQNNEFQKL